MANKNDLSVFKKQPSTPSVLQAGPKQIGRPRAVKKRTFKVTLSLTEEQGRRLQEEAGLAPLATFLMAKLREAGVLESTQ